MFIHTRLQFVMLSIIFALIAVTTGLIWWPFLKLLAIAGILAVLFWPLYVKVENRIGNASVAAIITIFILLLVLILPVLILGRLLFSELVNLYGSLREVHLSQSEVLAKLPLSVQSFAAEFLGDLGQKVGGLAGYLVSGLSQALSSAAGFFLGLFLVFFAVYYFLRDGKKIRNFLDTILPISESKENILVSRLSEAVSGVVKGAFLIALIQGFVATVGFLIFGVPNPFLWGSFTVLAALVPNVGTALSLVPAVMYLFLVDKTASAIGLAVWGALAVGLIDNILSPKLVGAQTRLHPLLVLFSILGGLKLFGFIGFLLGPILISMFVALVEVYRADLKKYLEN